ncbi:helix-turn-helix transcriptional regulator [Chryseobacterium binzhouense]|uniref:helix-turn-helix transcriptional regulator n=1 Tax=Chryseobacterium binzhouense TaxID=2593646 RepID=UPI00117D07A5|nr:LuxR C-terminal-related transcriptional regulator [Chryseobacterium binzhouense]
MKYLFFILLFAGFSSFSQSKKDSVIKKNLAEAEYYLDNFDDYKCFAKAYEAYNLAKNNKKYTAESCIYMASSSVNLNLYSLTLKYTKIGLLNCNDEDYFRKSLLYNIEGATYYDLGMFNQSLKSLHKAIAILRNTKDDYLKTSSEIRNYQHLIVVHEKMNNIDSIKLYDSKERSLIDKLPINTFADLHVNSHYLRVLRALNFNRRSEALQSLNSSYDICMKYDDKSLYIYYHGMGKYYASIDKEKALNFYLKSINAMEKYNIQAGFSEPYHDVSKLYEELGNRAKQNQYLKKYVYYQQREKAIKDRNVDLVLEMTLNDQKKKDTQLLKNIMWPAIFLLLIITIAVTFFIRKLKLKQSKLKNHLTEKYNEVEELQVKANVSFSEVVEYAKNNDPLFWARFQELYPNFLNKMLVLNSKLKVSELVLCAYIYLGFSNKEIAEYTFRSLRTIENNRYNLRKKLDFSKDEDFTVWIRKHIDSD